MGRGLRAGAESRHPWPKLLSPIVAFPILWIAAAALAQIHVLDIQRPFPLTTWVVIALVPAAFVVGGLIAQHLVGRVSLRPATSPPVLSQRLLVVLSIFVVIGYAELVHQWLDAGEIPLLSGRIDEARTGQRGGPTIVLINFLTVAVIVALATPSRLWSREAVMPLAIVGVGLCGFALQGGRGPVVLPIVVAFLARAFLWRLPSRRSILIGLSALALLSAALFYVRTDQHGAQPFERELYGEASTPRPLRPLLPLYLGIATNFTSLNGVVEHFPDGSPYGHGVYSAKGIDLLIPSARNLEEVTVRLTPPWITSTVAGPFWADGGPVLVVLGMAVTGAMVQASLAIALRVRSVASALVMAYLTYMALFGLYANLWTQYPDWIMVIPLLLVTGALAEGRLPLPQRDSALRTESGTA